MTQLDKDAFIEIRIASVAPGRPLPFDIYLYVNGKQVLFRKKGEAITIDRMKALIGHGGDKFLIPGEQKDLYLDALKSVIQDPSSDTELKAKFLKESAYLHLHQLFTKEDISTVVIGATSLVEEMVSFVSTDVAAVASLMRLSTHDYYTYNHCVDVAVYSIVLAKKIFGDDSQILIRAGLGGLLHDIGKRRIDLKVLNKSSPLSREEWEELKRHPEYGRDALKDLAAIPDESKNVVYEHHENFDGTGYPRGLKGDDIGKITKVVSIADVFDALTTDRPYHKAISPDEALNMMFGMQPGKFDPAIFKSFNKNFEKRSRLEISADFDPCAPQTVVKK